MYGRVEPFDILRRDPTHVFGKGERARLEIIVKPAVSVEAAIHPDDLKPLLQKLRPENGADISVDAGNQYPHSRHLYLAKRVNPLINKIVN
jgi:hypothetical protein